MASSRRLEPLASSLSVCCGSGCLPSLPQRLRARPNACSPSLNEGCALAAGRVEEGKTGGRHRRKSKQMTVPGKRLPPTRGNSSDLNLTLTPQTPQYKTYSPLFFIFQQLDVSEMCPSRLKQHRRADSSKGLIDDTVTEASWNV